MAYCLGWSVMYFVSIDDMARLQKVTLVILEVETLVLQ